jgi:hypothetical protein
METNSTIFGVDWESVELKTFGGGKGVCEWVLKGVGFIYSVIGSKFEAIFTKANLIK